MNMLDYLTWRGDVSFAYDPFNEVDNLLLAQLAYVSLDKIFAEHKSLSIKEIADAYFAQHKHPILNGSTSFLIISPAVLKELAASKRFASCRVYNYVAHLYNYTTEQFGAMMIDLPDGTTVVSYRGTDDSLIGWKEDLMLSYTEIPSQEEAVNYLNKYCSRLRKYRLIGHSKGGNLALYAAMHCKPSIQSRIIQIISDDGPGLRPGSFDQAAFEKLAERYLLIVPEKDAVGTIYEMNARRKVVRCDRGNIILAHNMITWQVEANHLLEADRNAYETNLNRQSLIRFLQDSTPKQREIFVKELFNSFEEEKIVTVSQLSAFGIALIPKVLKKLSDMDDEAKKVAALLIKSYSGILGGDAYRQISNNIDTLIEEYRQRRNARRNSRRDHKSAEEETDDTAE